MRSGAHRQAATTLKERRQDSDRYRHRHKQDKRRRFASPCCQMTVMASSTSRGRAEPAEHTEVGAKGAAHHGHESHRGGRQRRDTSLPDVEPSSDELRLRRAEGCLPSSRPSTWDVAAAHHPRPAAPAERATPWRAATPARPPAASWTPPPRNFTGLVDTLERDGLIERLPHPHDRRASCWPPSAPPWPSCWPSSRGRPTHPAGLGVAAHRAGTDISNDCRLGLASPRPTRAQTGTGRHAESSNRRRPAGDRPPSLRQRSPSTCCAGLRRMHPVGGRLSWTS